MFIDARRYVYNRWLSRCHACTANPRHIRPGNWCDLGNRFLPCLFDELVDFVEIEQAWHFCSGDEAARKKFNVPWWRRRWPHWRNWRCPEAGLAYLDWASSLTNDEKTGVREDDPDYGQPTDHAIAAREIGQLYLWWKHVFPQRRLNPNASEWIQYCELRRRMGLDPIGSETRSPEDVASCPTPYADEDEMMLIRLIKVRGHLWT
jgi:hypothetical protein